MGDRRSKAEEAVKKWLSERGYDYEVRTYVPDEPEADAVKREKDTISIPVEVEDVEAFIERFYCLAQEDKNPPLGRYEKYPEKDCALLMTAADNFFWTFEQAVSYYQFAVVNYIGFHDKGMLLAGGCGDTNGRAQIDKTNHLAEVIRTFRSRRLSE